MSRDASSLWRHSDFLKLWASWTISVSGSQVTTLALPLAAALTLNASPVEMGILVALKTLPYALIGLFAGVWVDRTRRLPILIGSDVASGVFLLAVPVAAWLGLLSMELLFAVSFLCGVVTVVAGAAHQTYITGLVGRQHLVEAHSKLYTTVSGAETLGPGVAGMLVHAIGAPFAILLDALTFFVSGGILRSIKAVEPAPAACGAKATLKKDIREGLEFIWRSPLLRSLVWTLLVWQLLYNMYAAVVILFATRELGLSAASVGAAYMMTGIGSLLAALSAKALVRQFGVGNTILNGFFFAAIAWQGLALVGSDPVVSVVQLGCGLLLFSFGATLATINYVSLRQAATPDAILGRMTSTMRFLTAGVAAPVGALIGGALGSVLGLRATLAMTGGAALVLVLCSALFSPMRLVRDMPDRAGAAR